jgi:choline dehydrogenase
MTHFLVVGAGSAGAILASRLSESKAHAVTLLEAGPDHPTVQELPEDLRDSRGLGGAVHQWGYQAEALPGRIIPYPRGRVVGGTGAINAAAAQWGRPEDFAIWQTIGLSEWGWVDVEPWYRHLERDLDSTASHHGRNGAIPISRYRRDELIPVQRAFHDACVRNGFRDIHDHNDPASQGPCVGPWPMNRICMTRITSALAHLQAARGRSNLSIRPNTMVDRLLIDKQCIIGVRLASGEEILADYTVLAAGSFGSAAMLMRSGIGPAGDLAALGIEPILDHPSLGTHLLDHAAVPIYLVPRPDEAIIGRDPRFQLMARLTAEESDDMQLVPTSWLDLRATPAVAKTAGAEVVTALRVALLLPKGHGSMRLTSTDPAAPPAIHLNYAAEPEDLQRFLIGLRLAWQVVKAMPSAYQRIAFLNDEIVASDEALISYISTHIGTYCHALGTIPMGRVVDQRCKLRGLGGLSVVDASVFPSVPRVVGHLTIMMIAERVAAWLGDAGRPS